jgi:uncharacterized delta-60 repeat protein
MRKLNHFVILCIMSLGLIFANKSANAAAGNLDTTFGRGGVTVTPLAASGSAVIPFSVQLQSDGKILVLADVLGGGTDTSNVLRYTSNGVLDPTFGSNGIAVLPATLGQSSLALQPNGQIVVAGTDASTFTVERLNTNGTMDTSFGNGGVASASLNGRIPGTQLVALILTNGDIMVVGQLEPVGRGQPFETLLARFNPNGALDQSFGTNGAALATSVTGCTALAETSSGDILVVNGQTIAQFTSTGFESTPRGESIVASAGGGFPSPASTFQSNGEYLLAKMVFIGAARARNGVVQVQRFASTGGVSSDFFAPSFHFAGTGSSTSAPNAIAVEPNGDIVVVGVQSTPTQTGAILVNALARLTPSGNLDSTFGTNGTVTNSVPAGTQGLEGVAIQLDGNIVTVGIANNSTALTVSRYHGQ